MLLLETRGGVPTGGRRRSTSLSRDRGAPAGLGGPGRRPSYLDDVLVDRTALHGLQHVHHRAVLLNAHHPDGHRDGLSSDDGRVQDLRVLHGREGGTCQQAGTPAAAGGVPNPALHPDTCSAPQPSASTLPAPTLPAPTLSAPTLSAPAAHLAQARELFSISGLEAQGASGGLISTAATTFVLASNLERRRQGWRRAGGGAERASTPAPAPRAARDALPARARYTPTPC